MPVDREPREARRVALRPFGQQRRLSVARGSGNDREGHVRRVEPIDERGPAGQVLHGPAAVEFRHEQVVRCARWAESTVIVCTHRGRPCVSPLRPHCMSAGELRSPGRGRSPDVHLRRSGCRQPMDRVRIQEPPRGVAQPMRSAEADDGSDPHKDTGNFIVAHSGRTGNADGPLVGRRRRTRWR